MWAEVFTAGAYTTFGGISSISQGAWNLWTSGWARGCAKGEGFLSLKCDDLPML